VCNQSLLRADIYHLYLMPAKTASGPRFERRHVAVA
jgi:hypothetical protein